jgi:hypothetical protein
VRNAHDEAVVMTATTTCIASASPYSDAAISIRLLDGGQVDIPLRQAGAELLADAIPWRNPRWYNGQPHYPGHYWSTTEHDYVTYESLLEKSRLIKADFDPTVLHIVAQPFLLRATIDGVVRRHVPDYLLFRGTDLTVSDVKPAERLQDPRVAVALGWARDVIEDAGWQFEVFCEPHETEMANIRFFAGYRHTERISPVTLAEMRARNLDGVTFGEAVAWSDSFPARARAALLHMLWRQELEIDLSRPLAADTTLYEVK